MNDTELCDRATFNSSIVSVNICHRSDILAGFKSTGPHKSEQLSTQAQGRAETVLVVEDEPLIRKLVCKLLKREGYSVLEAQSADEALEVFRESQKTVDLLLTDIAMPGEMNGCELAHKLCAENPHLKVLYASGYNPLPRQGDGRHSLIAKPFSLAFLSKAVRRTLDGQAIALPSAASIR